MEYSSSLLSLQTSQFVFPFHPSPLMFISILACIVGECGCMAGACPDGISGFDARCMGDRVCPTGMFCHKLSANELELLMTTSWQYIQTKGYMTTCHTYESLGLTCSDNTNRRAAFAIVILSWIVTASSLLTAGINRKVCPLARIVPIMCPWYLFWVYEP
jgi:hypothetical protein